METQNSDDQEEESSSSPSSETMITNPRPNLRREPSFSRWCGDDDGSAHLLGHSPTASFDGVSIEVEGFELPLLPHDAIDPQQRTSYFRQRGTFAELKDRRHVHFDVEGGGGLHPNDSRAKLDLLEHAAHGHHPHSAVTMLKTAFYILVWYTFSTCLTLYNKALLGDKLGKFPAPLLMNTIHFTLQAVLSKAIGCYQHRGGTDGNFPMTWRDYFTKETGCQWLAMLPGIVFSRHQNIRSRSISNLLAPSPETAYLFSRMSFPRYCWVVPGCERRKKESGVMWCWNPMCVEHGTLILVAMRCGSHGTIGGVRFTKVASDGSCVGSKPSKQRDWFMS